MIAVVACRQAGFHAGSATLSNGHDDHLLPSQVAACICLFALDKHEAIPVDTHVWQVATRYYTPSLKGKTLNKQARAPVRTAQHPCCGEARQRVASEVESHILCLIPCLGSASCIGVAGENASWVCVVGAAWAPIAARERNTFPYEQVMSMVEAALIERFGAYAGWAHNTLFIAELGSHKVRSRRDRHPGNNREHHVSHRCRRSLFETTTVNIMRTASLSWGSLATGQLGAARPSNIVFHASCS